MPSFKIWVDKHLMSCANYAAANWCTINGRYGVSWNEQWGRIEDSKSGKSAWNCPQCGCIGL